MTQKVNALTVVLEKDIDREAAKAIISAIGQLRGVLSVKGNVADAASHIAETRVRNELFSKMVGIFKPDVVDN